MANLKSDFGKQWAESTMEPVAKLIQGRFLRVILSPPELDLGVESPATVVITQQFWNQGQGYSFKGVLDSTLGAYSTEKAFLSRLCPRKPIPDEEMRKRFLVRAEHIATKILMALELISAKKSLQSRVKEGDKQIIGDINALLRIAPEWSPLSFQKMSGEDVDNWNGWLTNWYEANGVDETKARSKSRDILGSGCVR
jgi:hypothetical protein